MASSRRLPLSYNIKTFGGATRDYTSFATWEAATDINLVFASKGEVLHCYADAASYDDYVIMLGATANSNYFRVIMPAPGHGHDGTPNSGFKIVNTVSRSSGAAIRIRAENYCAVHDLILENTAAANQCINFLDGCDGRAIVGCILTNSSGPAINIPAGADHIAIINSIAHNCSASGILNSASDVNIYNCTLYGNTIGLTNTGSAVVKNTIFQNNGTQVVGTINTEVTNIADNTVVFVDAAGGDFHLAVSDAAAKGQGTDLSEDAVYAFDDDIDADTISDSWCIGADWTLASGDTKKYLGVVGSSISKIAGIPKSAIARVINI